jgi:hypothetical protein
MTRGSLYVCDALLERLAEHLEHMTPELGQFVQEEHAMVRPRHLARHGDVPAADPPHIRDRVRRGATWPAGHQSRAPVAAAADAMDTGG